MYFLLRLLWSVFNNNNNNVKPLHLLFRSLYSSHPQWNETLIVNANDL